jgi:hypothetical protein
MDISKFMPTNDAEAVVPFGKYKGMPAEVLLADQKYLQWALDNNVVQKYERFYQTVIVNQSGEAADTPEHNALQARFLDDDFVGRVAKLAETERYKRGINDAAQEVKYVERTIAKGFVDRWHHFRNQKEADESLKEKMDRLEDAQNEYQEKMASPPLSFATDVQFEVSGFDVVIPWQRLSIELKPTMGEDYPSVLRQVTKAQSSRRMDTGEKIFVVIGEYRGKAVPLEQVKQIFAKSNVTLLTVAEVEAVQ